MISATFSMLRSYRPAHSGIHLTRASTLTTEAGNADRPTCVGPTHRRRQTAQSGQVRKRSLCGLRDWERHASENPQTTRSQKAVSHFKIPKIRERVRFWDSLAI